MLDKFSTNKVTSLVQPTNSNGLCQCWSSLDVCADFPLGDKRLHPCEHLPAELILVPNELVLQEKQFFDFHRRHNYRSECHGYRQGDVASSTFMAQSPKASVSEFPYLQTYWVSTSLSEYKVLGTSFEMKSLMSLQAILKFDSLKILLDVKCWDQESSCTRLTLFSQIFDPGCVV